MPSPEKTEGLSEVFAPAVREFQAWRVRRPNLDMSAQGDYLMLEFRNGDGMRKAYVFEIGSIDEERRGQFAGTLTQLLHEEAPEVQDVRTAEVTRDFVLRNLTQGSGSADYLVYIDEKN